MIGRGARLARGVVYTRRRQQGIARTDRRDRDVTRQDATEPNTPEHRHAVADGIAKDCGWSGVAQMRSAVLAVRLAAQAQAKIGAAFVECEAASVQAAGVDEARRAAKMILDVLRPIPKEWLTP